MIAIVFSIQLLPSAHAGPFTFPEQADQLAREVIRVFVEEGVCKDINECVRNEIVYRAGTDEHRTVQIYKIHTIRPQAISRAIQSAVNAYYANGRRATVEVVGYQESREEKARLFSNVKPIVHVILKEVR
ncbi:hypothetical protein [Hydrogenophaga sp. BPS33]|uniref:hypothetical protein n=1 Tax=Hydrogenophaga sp. BPS33 TaxID=2651974 RepID=UPI001F20DD95|nr:hypothetical protein [Hydrogenophaga sp. BPS33]